MSAKDSNWMFADDVIVEREEIAHARQQSLELGITPITASTGAQLAVLAAASSAENILEIGTGTGVSGLWLLNGAPTAMLTSIDSETENQQLARTAFAEARVPAHRIRLIAGAALDVLPRMNEASYDLVFVDGDPAEAIEYVEFALRLARIGGTVAVAHALWNDEVADPTQRNDLASGFRTLVTEIMSSSAVVAALSPVGDGLLQITRLAE